MTSRRKADGTHTGQDQLTTWVPNQWSTAIDDEVDHLNDVFESKVRRSDVVRAALAAYFDESEIKRENHYMLARNGVDL